MATDKNNKQKQKSNKGKRNEEVERLAKPFSVISFSKKISFWSSKFVQLEDFYLKKLRPLLLKILRMFFVFLSCDIATGDKPIAFYWVEFQNVSVAAT